MEKAKWDRSWSFSEMFKLKQTYGENNEKMYDAISCYISERAGFLWRGEHTDPFNSFAIYYLNRYEEFAWQIIYHYLNLVLEILTLCFICYLIPLVSLTCKFCHYITSITGFQRVFLQRLQRPFKILLPVLASRN